MSYLEGLIEEYCFDGVEFAPLRELTDQINERNSNEQVGEVRSVTSFSKLVSPLEIFDRAVTSSDTSNYKIVRNGMFVYNPSRINIGSIARSQENIPIIVSPMYVVFKVNEDRLLGTYLSMFLSSSFGKHQIQGMTEEGARFRFPYDALGRILIPLPPLPVQQEIVRILDNFTELTTELTTELEARKKQYEYYRDEFLTFDGSKELKIEWVALEELIHSLKTGLNPRKNFRLNTDDAKNYYVTVREIVDGKIVFFEKTDRVNDEALELIFKRCCLEKGDVLFSGTGTIGRIAVIEEDPINWGIKEGVYVIKPKQDIILPRYLAHILNSGETIECYKKKVVGSPVSSLPMSELKQLKIPVPSLEEQERIVAILDRFDALCNDLSIGLPAEIVARKKQYEYYRDKLLTFKEKIS